MHPTLAEIADFSTEELKAYRQRCHSEQEADDLRRAKDDALQARKALIDALIFDRKLNGAL